jgi:hypothetical protein
MTEFQFRPRQSASVQLRLRLSLISALMGFPLRFPLPRRHWKAAKELGESLVLAQMLNRLMNGPKHE